MEKRRQNSSCDQCRTAKKACDGLLVNGRRTSNASTFRLTPSGQISLEAILPCSYCVRTNKTCSLNPQWTKIRLNDEDSLGHPGSSSRIWPSPGAPNSAYGMPTPSTLSGDSNPMLHLFQNPTPNDFGWNPSSAITEDYSRTSMGNHPAPLLPDANGQICEGNMQPSIGIGNESWDFVFDAHLTSPAQPLDYGPQGMSTTPFDGTIDGSHHHVGSISPRNNMKEPSVGATSTLFKKRKMDEEDNQSRRYSQAWGSQTDTSLAHVTTDHAIAFNANKTLISESLLRVYHDVLENNLACWISEDTCPYRLDKQRQQLTLEQQPRPEWGSSWSNRMYKRVKQLDRVAERKGLIRLSVSESRAASKALDLVVLAFATQWSHKKHQKGADRESCDEEELDFGQEFEKTLHYSVWDQARRALQDLADLECFRVMYAELVFGLIQRPSIPHTANEERDPKGADRPAILAHIIDIMDQDGPPIILERGIRKIHAMKFRLEKSEAKARELDRQNQFTEEEKGTICLLYWLAIMFDTVSSSMNGRPVVVGDDECEHHAQQDNPKPDSHSRILNHKWRLELYAQDNPTNPLPLQWPCPYEEATTAVARSAAVKVLLFRYVSYLQKAIRKSESSEAVEEILQETMSVYRYWNKTHGAFFRDLTRHFESVPTRIKSWYPCIGIPWHYGTLMLADLIDSVDENRIGLEQCRKARLQAGLTNRMRRSSATELADLANVLVPEDKLSGYSNRDQLQDLHFAVSDSSVLTEPWTVLLVRGFAKAAIFHLDEVEKLRQLEVPILGYESNDFGVSIRRVQGCVRALYLLGTKSVMAKEIADAFRLLLQPHGTEGYQIAS